MLKKTTSQQDYETTSFFKRRRDAKTQRRKAFDSDGVM